MRILSTKHNFYPGPGALPDSVLARVEKEIRSYRNSGMSIMEFSHRSPEVVDLIDDTVARFRKLLNLEKDWELILLQGGGSMQFVMVPYNLAKPGERVDYIDTGYWTQRAIHEAKNCQRDLRIIADGKATQYHSLPDLQNIQDGVTNPVPRYLHICSNNTVVGTQWHQLPEVNTPLVIDASSDLLARELDLSKVNLLYAHAQKNVGLAGVTVVAIRKSALLEQDNLPDMLSYQAHINKHSNYHTPPVFSIYVTNLMLQWLENEMGGVAAIADLNRQKARLLYAAIDHSKLFHCPVETAHRSTMNAVFSTGNKTLDQQFVSYCAQRNIIGIAGHRSQQGLRASLYNAVSLDDVNALIHAVECFDTTFAESANASTWLSTSASTRLSTSHQQGKRP